MKYIAAFASVLLFASAAASAVTWNLVSVSIVVKSSSTTGSLQTTVLNNRKYLDFVAQANGVPKSDLFIGLNAGTNQVSVVRRSTETILYNIVGAPGGAAVASNNTSTRQSAAAPVQIASLSATFTGSLLDNVTRFGNGAIKSLKRTVIGGNTNQTIKGSIITTGKKIDL